MESGIHKGTGRGQTSRLRSVILAGVALAIVVLLPSLVDAAERNVLATKVVAGLVRESYAAPLMCGTLAADRGLAETVRLAGPGLSHVVALAKWALGDCEGAKGDWTKMEATTGPHDVALFWLSLADATTGDLAEAANRARMLGITEYLTQVAIVAYNGSDRVRGDFFIRLAVASDYRLSAATVHHQAWAYYELGTPEHALALIDAYRKSLPDDAPTPFVILGLRYRIQGNIQMAIQTYRAGLSEHPDDSQLLYLLRTTFADVGDARAALEIALRESALAEPGQTLAESRLTVARLYRTLGEYGPAEQWALDALEANPSWWPPNAELGTIKCLQGDTSAAEAGFRRALEQAPGRAEVIIARAECLYSTGNAVSAVSALEELRARSLPTSVAMDVYRLLGRIYSETGDIDKAKEVYSVAAQRWPSARWIPQIY